MAQHDLQGVLPKPDSFLPETFCVFQGSKSAIEHGLYVWKQVVLKSKAKKIAIVAHSAGGSVTASLISKYLDDFRKRVNAIAYTDAFGSPRNHGAFKYFKQVNVTNTCYLL